MIENATSARSDLNQFFRHSLVANAALAVVLLLSALPQSARAGGWYVGNTASTEWVQYKRVWLSAGSYRFTARAGSPAAGATFHVEVDNVTVQAGVAVPNTGRADSFAYVHLGRTALTQGYHDIKVVFDSANVSLDWFMLSKDTDTSTTVKPADYAMVRPDTSGMLVAPITAFAAKTGTTGLASALCSQPGNDINGQPYSDAQLKAWYSIPLYQDYDRRSDRFWDILVDELLSSRAQVPLVHCRGTKDFTRGLQDRDYAEAPGAFEGRWLMKFSEAVARNPQAASALKIGMFWESGGIADEFKKVSGYYPAWGDPALVDYVVDYWLSPWFDNVPPNLLYQPTPGRPIISFFSNHPQNMVSDGRMGDFLASVRSRLKEKYGYDPLFILPLGTDVDTKAQAQGWGQAPWVTWNGPLLETNPFGGKVWGTTMAGSRRRLDTVWLNDWNPATNTGTPNASDANGSDAFQSHLDGSNNSVLLNTLAQAKALGITLVQEEGFTNMAEGNALFRSDHPGWTFPNQHLAAMREYADPASQTLLFEAEGCDTYAKVVNDGNSGGSFRREWYAGSNNLDIYRPLHNLQGWIPKSAGPGNLSQISAGFYDAWALGADGKVWAQPIMGAPNTWTQVTNAPPALTALSVGKEYVWALKGTTVYSTKIPYQWSYWNSTGWTQRSGSMVQISAGTSEVWAVNASGQVFRRPSDGSGDWTQVAGTMDKVFAGDTFVWGIQGGNLFYTRTASVSWTPVANPNNITQLAVGSEEIWGVNAGGQVYRRSISGIGGWDSVSNPGGAPGSLAIGEGYAWALVGGTPYHRRLEGFQGATALAPMAPLATAGIGQVALRWTAVTGATGYNIKRGTVSGGPYNTTVQNNILPFTTALTYTDTTVANGTKYYYVVSALTPSETANSPEAAGTPQALAPAAASNLAVATGFGSRTVLGWSDSSSNEAGFKIERKSGTGSFIQIAVVPANTTTFTDAVPFGPDFTYRIRAYNAAGNSAYSNEAALSTSTSRLSRASWTASASTSAGGAVSNALDGSLSTRWATGGAQTPGQWFQLDMGAISTVFQIDMDIVNNDYPRAYEVYLSVDGVNWGSPVTTGGGASILTSIPFAPQTARYIRIVQTGSTPGTWWGIYEINVYGQPGQELSRAGWTFSASASGSGNPAANAGDNNPTTRWSTGVAQANGQWFQADMGTAKVFHEVILDAGSSTNDYPRGYEIYVSNNGTSWGPPVASGTGSSAITVVTFPEQVARYVRVVQTGSNGASWSIHEFRVYGWPAISRAGWIATASVSGGSAPAPNAIDGNIGTRWGTGGAQANGQWFQVDMGSPQAFRRLVLDSAASTNDYPRGYQVYVSNDGSAWGSAVATGAGASAQTVINFLPQTARYIRVVQTGSTGGTWWSIHEFDVYSSIVNLSPPTGLSTTAGNAQVGLTWNSVLGAASYTIKRATSSGGPYTVLASGVTGTSYTDATAPNGTTYYYTVSAANGGNAGPESAFSTATAGILPSPWQSADIGSVGVLGYAYSESPVYTAAGSGADIWSTADGFRYAFQASSGDCSVVARVTSQQNTHSGAKAGVMLRESVAAGSINAAVVVTPSGGLSFQWRPTTGASSQSTGGGSATLPIWVRVTRTGNSVAGYKSTDGVNWTQIGTSQTLGMAASALIGLSVSSHNNAVTSAVTYDNVTATP